MNENAKLLAISISVIEVPAIFWGFWSLVSKKDDWKFGFDSAKFGGGGPVEPSSIKPKRRRRKRNANRQEQQSQDLQRQEQQRQEQQRQEQQRRDLQRQAEANRREQESLRRQAEEFARLKRNQELEREEKESENVRDEYMQHFLGGSSSETDEPLDDIAKSAGTGLETIGRLPGLLLALWIVILCFLLNTSARSAENTPDGMKSLSNKWKLYGYIHIVLIGISIIWALSYNSKMFFYSIPFFVTQIGIGVILTGQNFHKC